MPLGFHRHRKEKEAGKPATPPSSPPEFQFFRSDTHSITPIDPETDKPLPSPGLRPDSSTTGRPRAHSRSERLKAAFTRHRRSSDTSIHVPENLPQIDDVGGEDAQAKWEKRATMLARAGSTASVQRYVPHAEKTPSVTPKADANIQEAIRLHEAGELEKSSAMFKELADPLTHNNPLSQVLYGLALRHGWGVPVNTAEGIEYLKLAAQSSAMIEDEALKAGMSKGGAAKGELVLAIFELANCFRHGWGVEKDPKAAFQYYLTAANLGDADAQNELAWCYQEGFGCKKSRYDAAKYYRLAEKQGNKILGNSWIWKEKYNPKDT